MLMKAMGAVIAVLLVAVGILYWQLSNALESIGTLKANVAVAERAVGDQREVLDKVQKLYEGEQARVAELQVTRDLATEQRDAASRKLQSLQGRLRDAAMGRPGLVGRRATEATRDVMCDFYEVTGGEPGGC